MRRVAGRAGLVVTVLAHAVFHAACGSSAPTEESSRGPVSAAPLGGPAPAAGDEPPAPVGRSENKVAVSAPAREVPAPLPSATIRPIEMIGKDGGELVSLGAPAPPRSDELVGLAPAAVAAFLGPPGFKRRDDPAEIWRYAAGTCFLDLFLYKRGSGYTVAHFEARGKSVVKVSADDCLRDLFKTRNRGESR